jgi:hypothetical protein
LKPPAKIRSINPRSLFRSECSLKALSSDELP